MANRRASRLLPTAAALTKPRLSALVALSAAASAWAAAPGAAGAWPVAALGVWLAALGASALNQALEAERDARMVRTAGRPVPSGRVSRGYALALGAGLTGAGALSLTLAAHPLAGVLALATAVLYVGLYTPLKTRTTLNTLVGAVCGALPPLVGWAAVRGRLDPPALFLAALLFAWQFPHFLAVAWLHRRDYERAGFRMLPVVDPGGRLTFEAATLYALVLVFLAPAAALNGAAGWSFGAGGALLGLGLLGACRRAGGRRSTPAVRDLFLATLLYLPLALALFAFDRGAPAAQPPARLAAGPAAVRGDGIHVETYGFDLGRTVVDPRRIQPARMPRDYLAALVAPDHVDAAGLALLDRAQRGRFLVARDRVVGVVLGGEARAYPVRVLRWHEVVNDELGGVPIAVTYNTLCDSVRVFRRRVAGAEREFRVSGLLLESNLLFYDRAPAGRESLWSQLLGRAVTGPLAGTRLRPVRHQLVPWGVWRRMHPTSTVLKPPGRLLLKRLYDGRPLVRYFSHDRLLFPVSHLPPPDVDLPRKARVVVVRAGGLTRVYPLPWVARRARRGPLQVRQGGVDLFFDYFREADAVLVTSNREGEPEELIHTFWFAWAALHPEARPAPEFRPR